MKTCLLVNAASGGWGRLGGTLASLAAQSGTPIIDICSAPVAELVPSSGRVVIAGGDGTISTIVNAVGPRIRELEIALVPTGTGNDLARSLDLFGRPPEEIWQSCLTAAVSPIDLVRVVNGDTSYIVNAATGGFGGMVSTDVTSDDKGRWGALAYWFTAFSKIAALKEYRVRIELDSETRELDAYGLAITNGRYVGGGFPVAPDAKLNDGLLDVTTVPNLPTIELLAAGLDFMIGRHDAVDRVETIQSAHVRVIAEPRIPYSFDGETVRSVDATFDVVTDAMNVVAGEFPPAL
ncbi:MAG: YegS/Rv2252/BmrU family lipid kinase [Pirellulaceae bacterium]|nr:YegS/Rv2252/BmrU family lipid kinase [Pirellulaceae bacterium]